MCALRALKAAASIAMGDKVLFPPLAGRAGGEVGPQRTDAGFQVKRQRARRFGGLRRDLLGQPRGEAQPPTPKPTQEKETGRKLARNRHMVANKGAQAGAVGQGPGV